MTRALVPGNPFEPARQLVLNAVSSPLTRAMYARALDDFFVWYAAHGSPAFTRATVQQYRAHLEAQSLAPSSINQKLSAIRKLAAEAAYNGLMDPAAAQAVRDVRGAKTQGARTGNWLTKRQAEALINRPDPTTLKGRRDRRHAGGHDRLRAAPRGGRRLAVHSRRET